MGRRTLGELGCDQLSMLATATDISPEQPVRIFTHLLGASAARSSPKPGYASDVVDDHTPYEFSVAFNGTSAELRMLVETIDDEGDTSLPARWAAARRASAWLRDEYGADLSKLDRIADLFEPKTDSGLFALWHAVVFRPNAKPDVKIYVDLRARGAALSAAVLEEALARLDLSAAYHPLVSEACARGTMVDELVYFSLDLAAHDRARVKAYVRHHYATADDLEKVIGTRGGVAPGEVTSFLETVLGSTGPYKARPIVSCWSFSEGKTGATLYAPVAYYVRDDAEARDRVHRWANVIGTDVTRYDRCIASFARRPLDQGVGMHSYVSWKREGGNPKLTTYFAPEAYATAEPGSLAMKRFPVPRRPAVPTDLVHWLETVEKCTDHPLFRRLGREPATLAPLWTILANNWVGIGNQFPRWLAGLVARVEDDRVRSVLAKQLDDELGHGVPDQAHRLLFQRMLSDLEPWAPDGDRERLLAPGRRLASDMAHNYLAKPELEAIGGTLVAEIYGKQVDQAIGALLRRQNAVDVQQLTWLVLHEQLEEDHAEESFDLAAMLPSDPASQAAVCRGAEALAQLGTRYFDDIYRVVFA